LSGRVLPCHFGPAPGPWAGAVQLLTLRLTGTPERWIERNNECAFVCACACACACVHDLAASLYCHSVHSSHPVGGTYARPKATGRSASFTRQGPGHREFVALCTASKVARIRLSSPQGLPNRTGLRPPSLRTRAARARGSACPPRPGRRPTGTCLWRDNRTASSTPQYALF
jgi:hypothetical protein